MKNRLAAFAAAVSVAAGIVLAGGTAAQAAVGVKFSYGTLNYGPVISAERTAIDDYMGDAEWFQDPSEYYTGDTIAAADYSADGYGIEAYLVSTSGTLLRTATTRGHSSIYIDYASGNLPENTKYFMYMCVVQGSYSNCSNSVAVYS